ncbi:hypothetical protein MMC16_007124 [Acarospora aff. strigata]|nr:hypothetical protein [Acarospora aff. strigata]
MGFASPRQCLLDAVEDTNWKCPNCSSTLTERSQSGKQQLLCNIINEGGVLAGHDILPLLVEDTYLRSHPEERRCHAFLEFCREGDVEAMADVLRDDEGEDDNILTTDNDILRYQDPLGSMSSGLHIAVEAKQSQVAWMLLLLASNLDLEQFPPEVHRAADILGVARQDQSGKVDIRTLRDAEGRTAEQLAIPIGGIWDEWLNRGRLAG